MSALTFKIDGDPSGLIKGVVKAREAVRSFHTLSLSPLKGLKVEFDVLKASVNTVAGAVRVATGTIRALGSGATSALRNASGAARGTVTLFHELNGAAQTASAAMNTILGPVKLAAAIESSRVKFRVLIGDVQKADGIFANLTKLADQNAILGLSDVADAAAKLASTNIEKGGIPEFLRQLGQASSSAENFQSLVRASSQVLSKGGKVQMEELIQMSEAGLDVITELPKVLKVSGEEFAAMQQRGEVTFAALSQAIANLTTGTGRYAGMAEAAAQTTEGKWNNVVVAVDKAKLAFGEQVIIGIQPALESALALAQDLAPQAKAAGEKVKEMILFLTAAFKSNQLGSLVGESLQLAGYQFIDLMSRGTTAIAKNLGEELSDAVSAFNDKVLSLAANPFTSPQTKIDAMNRDQARQKGLMDPGKTLSQHFGNARSGLDGEMKRLSDSIANRFTGVSQYSGELVKKVEEGQATAGTKNGSGQTAPAVGTEKSSGSIQTQGHHQMPRVILPPPDLGGGGVSLDGVGGNGTGAAPVLDSMAGALGGFRKGVANSKAEDRLGRKLIRGAGFGKKDVKGQSGLDYLKSGDMAEIKTPGLDGLKAMQRIKGAGAKLDPAALAQNTTNRTNNKSADRKEDAAAQKDAKSLAAADAAAKLLPAMAADLAAMKNHLSKIQSR